MQTVIYVSSESLYKQHLAKLLEVSKTGRARLELIGGVYDGLRLNDVDYDPTRQSKNTWHHEADRQRENRKAK